MKKELHPKYQQILFVDSSTGYRFVCGSTLQPKETEVFEGKEYPVYRLSVSSHSHPFFTGSKALVDAEGRVDKFKKRYSAAQKANNKPEEKGESKEQGKKGEEKAEKTKAKAPAKAKAEPKAAKGEENAENSKAQGKAQGKDESKGKKK